MEYLISCVFSRWDAACGRGEIGRLLVQHCPGTIGFFSTPSSENTAQDTCLPRSWGHRKPGSGLQAVQRGSRCENRNYILSWFCLSSSIMNGVIATPYKPMVISSRDHFTPLSLVVSRWNSWPIDFQNGLLNDWWYHQTIPLCGLGSSLS